MQEHLIEVWSDVVCPWCAIGRVRLAKAVEAAGLGKSVHIIHRAFELDPTTTGARPVLEVLQERYGPDADPRGMSRRVQEVAAAEGIRMNPAGSISVNTFDAHRLLLWARESQRDAPLMEELVNRHFTAHENIADHTILQQAVEACGLDGKEAARILASDEFRNETRADEQDARQIGITGVPFFVFDRKFGMSGAQPIEAFQQVLEKMVTAAKQAH